MAALRWPNLFIVGAGKAGTSSLSDYLNQHPEIFMSPVKEPHFFSDARPALETPVRDEERYLRLFEASSTEKLLGEASISYFWDPASPLAIKRVSPAAKILVLLREPLERSYSHYWHALKNGVETRSFLEAVEDELGGRFDPQREPYLERSLYTEPLERYLTVFGKSVLVLFFEELARDVVRELKTVFDFLGVTAAAAERIDTRTRNAFALPRNRLAATLVHSRHVRQTARAIVPQGRRTRLEQLLLSKRDKPPIEAEALTLVDGFFDADRVRLERLLGRPLPW
jgi:Sulfotransferase domain